MKKHAFALLAITHAHESFAAGATILDMDAGQFNDWKTAELVREATPAEVSAAKSGNSTPAKPRKARTKRTPAADPTPDPVAPADPADA